MNIQPKSFDILVHGPLCVDLQGEQIGSSLKEMISFRPYPGGFAAFTIGLNRLGLKTALAGHIGNDKMGIFLSTALKREKIDVSLVCQNKNISTPIRFVATHERQEAFCLDSKIDLSLFPKCQALLLSSLQETPALEIAHRQKTKVILVLEGNAKLPDENVSPLYSVIFLKDVNDPLAYIQKIRKTSKSPIVLLHKNKIGILNDNLSDNWEEMLTPLEASHEMAKIASISGFIAAWLQQNPLSQCLETALNCHSITQARENNSCSLPSKTELSLLKTSQNNLLNTSLSTAYFQHVHYASTQQKRTKPYFVFNFGNKAEWQEFGKNYTKSESLISNAAFLVQKALEECALSQPFTLMTDKAPGNNFSSFSCLVRELIIEEKEDLDISRVLITWPRNHLVKVTLPYHPDDPFAIRKQQESTLSLLHRACRATSHQLWVELLPPSKCLITAGTFSHIMRRFFEIGIYPNVWQIAPPRDQRSWDGMERVLAENDPYCQGVVLSAQSILEAQLPYLLKSIGNQKLAKGLVFNRSIIQSQLEAWYKEQLSEEDFILQVKEGFLSLVSYWTDAQAMSAPPLEKALIS